MRDRDGLAPARRIWTRAIIPENFAPYGSGQGVRTRGDRPGARPSAFQENESAAGFVAASMPDLDIPHRFWIQQNNWPMTLQALPGPRFRYAVYYRCQHYIANYTMRRHTMLTDIAWAAGTWIYVLVRVHRSMYLIQEQFYGVGDLE